MARPLPDGRVNVESFTLLYESGASTFDAAMDTNDVWLSDAHNVANALGWELNPEGLCQGDICIPVGDDILRDEMLSLGGLAGLLDRPLATSDDHAAAYLGPPMARYEETVGHLEAPDFTLPDLDGNQHSLSEHRGSKILLAAWASW